MIRVANISKIYRTGSVPVRALRDVSIHVASGEFVAIMGPSGSGKSTLMHLLGLLDTPEKGSYELAGTEVSKLTDSESALLRNHLFGFVFQQFHLLGRVTALENTELPLIYAGRRNMIENAGKKLKEVGLGKREKHTPSGLSGGEQQRVAIARALVNNPSIIFADEPTGNLDTKSSYEIMRILEELNKSGKTIIMVTHEEEIAKYAKRIIIMRDGKIVSDKFREKPGAGVKPCEPDLSVKKIMSEKHSSLGKTELAEHLRQSICAVLSNKVRSFLSVLGILFGVAAVIAMLALGEGARASMEERIKSLGSNLLSIRGGSMKIRGAARAAGSITRFGPGDINAIRELPMVKRVSGYVSGSGQIVYKNENWNTRVEGVGYDYGLMRAAIPEIGRWFAADEIVRRDKSAIIGVTVADKLFGNKNPIGEIIKVNRVNFKVIGITPEKGARGWRDQDDIIYIPVTTAMYRVLGKDYFDGIYVEANNAESIKEAEEAIEALIVKRHRIYKNPEDYFHIRNMSEIQEMLSSTTKTMSLLLGCIAAISLLVGGIGIMNIMLVSVTERTKEIGLRKAIGACKKDIMSQFLIEAVFMTFSGGLMGIALGSGAALILSVFAGWATKISVFSVILATTFSVIVGIVFGLWPAMKASELEPIEALRYE